MLLEFAPDLANGNISRVGPDGVETLVQFDLANRVELIDRGPVGGSLVSADYTYYDNGLVHTEARGSGTLITYQYDASNRLERKRCQDGMALPLFSWVLWRFCSDHFCACLGMRFGQ